MRARGRARGEGGGGAGERRSGPRMGRRLFVHVPGEDVRAACDLGDAGGEPLAQVAAAAAREVKQSASPAAARDESAMR